MGFLCLIIAEYGETRVGLLSVVWLAGALLTHAQASPEEAAIAEILTAKDLSKVEKHLPEQLRTALDAMNKTEREQLLSRPRAMMIEKGLKISESSDGQALIAFDVEVPDADIKHFEIRTRRRISNGVEAVLVLSMVAPERSWGETEVWMRVEEGEWRVREFTDPSNGERLDLEDPETIAEIAPTPLQANERSAIGALRTLVSAVFFYRLRLSQTPESIEALGSSADIEVGSQHVFLIDSEFDTEHVHSGYRFDYERTSIDSYQITASPLEFGKSGSRNYFVDESGVIRFTDEDRKATVNDPPLDAQEIG